MYRLIEITIGGQLIQIPTYNLIVGLSIILLLFFLPVVFFKTGITIKKAIASTLTAIFFALIGARSFFYILYPSSFNGDFSNLFTWELRDFTLYGGVFGAFIGICILSRIFSFSIFELMDRAIWLISICLFTSRLGCLFNGCCYGKVTKMPWGIEMAKGSLAYKDYIKSHPLSFFMRPPLIHFTQVYELIVIVIALLVGAYFLNWKKKVRIDGVAAICFGIALTIGRFIVFWFRAFPYATDVSNLIRGPVIYTITLLLLFLLLMTRIKNKSV